MDTYEKEIFKFLSEPENFKSMCSLANQYPKIKKQLLIEFWNSVKESMNEIIKRDNLPWNTKLTGESMDAISNDKTKMLIYKQEYPLGNDGLPIISVAFERMGSNNWPFLGLFLNNNTDRYNLNLIRSKAIEFSSNKAHNQYISDNDDWYPFWKGLEIDFSKDTELERILPQSRNDLIIEFATEALNLANDCEELINELLKIKE